MKLTASWLISFILVAISFASTNNTGRSASSALSSKASTAATVLSPSSRPANADENRPELQPRDARYQLSLGDVVDLNFPLSPEFNQTVTVQPDGYISLLAVGDLRVVGQTLPQLRQSLQTAYSKLLHQPIISVTLREFNKPYFVIDGDVQHPGKYDLRGATTAGEAIAIAGGYTNTAKDYNVLLFHQVRPGWWETKRLNLKKMSYQGDLREDAYLAPGDRIFVPLSNIGRVRRLVPTPQLGLFFRTY